ncbi:osmotically inducible protein OsmC [candidate division BRC1 bacterium HGW-BRC1-1]|jgi:putative redox protein|nr:MAG: osmotically inducible protein OsmC [candidate division BRC1 bacterium HGW-BRC1-1]
MAVEMGVVYRGDLACEVTHGPSGAKVTTDAPVDNGGRGAAFSPTDLVAAALGACLVTIMGLTAKTSGLDIDGTRIHVTKEMAAAPMRRISRLVATVTLPHGKFSESDRAKLEASARLCPVKQSLHPDTEVVMEFVYPGE